MPSHHLAQVNVARLLAPLDSAELAGFVDGLEPVNRLADEAPGFVWRLQTDDGDATALRVFDDEMTLVNLSVWESLEALSGFVYRTDHRDYLARRRQWFERVDGAHMALWWVPAGHQPPVEEAKERLEILAATGPSARAFTFRRPFGRPDPSAQV